MKQFRIPLLLIFSLFPFFSCGSSETPIDPPADPVEPQIEITDDDLLDFTQKASLDYMWEGADKNSGMAYERIHLDNAGSNQTVLTTGGTGFGIAGLIVAMERGWIERSEGVLRLKKIVDFLAEADRFHGAWPHWLNASTGRVSPFSTKDDGGDLVETSFLLEGLLCARQYMNRSDETERLIAEGIDKLWKEVEFDWYTRGEDVLYWHWSPTYEWEMNLPIRGYNECMITYVLAASSPTHSIEKSVYEKGWARSGDIRSESAPYGHPLLLHHNGAAEKGGPLFWAHYSWIGLCPKGLKDQYADYWQAMVNHVLANRDYCIQNPKRYKGYGPECWGLTASYSPGGYSAHAPNNDLGVITPTAALSSMPYAPESSLAALRYFYSQKTWILGKYGFYDAFSLNPSWTVPRYLAIDQLTIAPMIENYRTGLLWRLFMSCPEVQTGLKNLGFTISNEN